MFSFATMLTHGTEADWRTSLLDGIVSRLERWLPSIEDAPESPTTEQWMVADYRRVREHKIKKLGVHFLKKR